MAEELPPSLPEQGLEKAEAADFVDIITKQNPRLFNGINSKKRQEIVQAISVGFTLVQKSHSGPLPDAETLEHYARIIPNGAERVMAMAEKEQDYRHGLTKKVSSRQLNQIFTGQVFGFILALIAIGGGIYLSYSGKETSGLATIISAMVLLVGAFIVGKVQEKK
jgi:uncharacterized membrane protein